MILLIGATAVSLTALQATINAPRNAFRDCMREASAKARSENVTGDNFEAYMRNSCGVQIGSLRNALQAFNLKNGMAKKAAAADADLTIEDYVASPVEHYRFMTSGAASGAAPAAPAPASAAAAAAAPVSQPPKP
ncbi:MAG: hypothetical protein V4491_03710 [Pseudomonadota bacterium]